MIHGRVASPRVWVLLGKGLGGNGMMIRLAEALGWPWEARQLHFNGLNLVPNLLLGASSLTLDRRRSASLEPPWPDLVIAASRRSAPIARWIRKRSGGRTRLVHLLHTQAPLQHFDLVITMVQFGLPQRENVLRLTGTLNAIDRSRLERARSEWSARLARFQRPWIGLLVGGNSSSYAMDAGTAARLGRLASEFAARSDGTLLVSSSPRTPPKALEALERSLTMPAFVYRWRPDDQHNNPYHGLLALADGFIVTIDSASMMVEAANSGRPVAVFDWPAKRRPIALARIPFGSALAEKAIDLGLYKPSRRLDGYFDALRERGLVHRLGEDPLPVRKPMNDLEQAVQRIRALFSHPQ